MAGPEAPRGAAQVDRRAANVALSSEGQRVTLASTTMAEREPFVFGRYRGLVWVCDIKGSSTYLNDPRSALDMEKFLPRMLTVAHGIVEAAGGELIKFTGDGFLGA